MRPQGISRRSTSGRLRALLVAALLLCVAFVPTVWAALEPAGVAQFTSPAVPIAAVAAQPDGKVVAAGNSGGQMIVERVSAAGAAEAAFNAGAGTARSIAVQPDGKIVVAGDDASGMLVRRLNADGSLDAGFGSSGTARLPLNAGYSVAIAPSGGIVVGGSVVAGDGYSRVALARFNAAGVADTSFGNSGVAVFDFGALGTRALGVAIQSDCKVVFAGEWSPPNPPVINPIVGRVTANGAPDGSFSGNGVYEDYFHPNGGAAGSFRSVAVTPSGRIVAAGAEVESDNNSHALFVGLTPGGALDGGFGIGGASTPASSVNFGGGEIIGPRSVAIAGGGEIVSAGAFQDSGLRTPVIYALTPTGHLDGSAPGGGVVRSSLEGEARGITVAPDGTVFTGGDLREANKVTGGFVERYNGFGAPPAAAGGSCGGGTTGPTGPTGTTGPTGSTGKGQAPVAATSAARRITDTSAILAGTVNPRGTATSYRFEYGATTAYGTQLNARTLGALATSVPVAVSISGLRPNRVYHYRLIAQNPNGVSRGADRTFRTFPKLTSSVSRVATSYSISSLNATGIPLSVRANQASTASASLIVTRATARSLGLGSNVTLGRVSARLSAGRSRILRLRPTSAARRALVRRHTLIRATVRLITTATGSGRKTTVNRATKLRP